MENEKISIILPTYNRANLIEKSIESVLNQTYQNFELIIIDDGSTDNTEEIIQSIDDDRIRYIKYETNKGATYARNLGIKEATGDYISFQDSDDIYLETKLEEQYNNLITNESDMDFCKVDIDLNFTHLIKKKKKQLVNVNKEEYFKELVCGNYIITASILIKKEKISENFDERLPRLQEYDLLLRIVKDLKLSFTDKILLFSYRQDDSIGSSYEKLLDAVKIMLKKDYGLSDSYENDLIEYLINLCISEHDVEFIKQLNELNEINFTLSKANDDLNDSNNILNDINVDLNNANAELKKKKHDLSKFNKELKNRNEELKSENNKLKQENDKLNKLNHEIISSQSWKITKPLRAINSSIKKNKKI